MKSNLRRDLVKALALASVAGPTMMRGAFAQQDVVKVIKGLTKN